MKVFVVCVDGEYVSVFNNHTDAENLIFNQLKKEYGYKDDLEEAGSAEGYYRDWIGKDEKMDRKNVFTIYEKEV